MSDLSDFEREIIKLGRDTLIVVFLSSLFAGILFGAFFV